MHTCGECNVKFECNTQCDRTKNNNCFCFNCFLDAVIKAKDADWEKNDLFEESYRNKVTYVQNYIKKCGWKPYNLLSNDKIEKMIIALVL
jgi:hypothetical protein